MYYNIGKEWTEYLPGRSYREGKSFDGMKLFHDVLEPQFGQNIGELIAKKEGVVIDFSDVLGGVPPSFLDDAFGSFACKYGINETLQIFQFVSAKDPKIADKAAERINKSNG